jgi:hypothetical protein
MTLGARFPFTGVIGGRVPFMDENDEPDLGEWYRMDRRMRYLSYEELLRGYYLGWNPHPCDENGVGSDWRRL